MLHAHMKFVVHGRIAIGRPVCLGGALSLSEGIAHIGCLPHGLGLQGGDLERSMKASSASVACAALPRTMVASDRCGCEMDQSDHFDAHDARFDQGV